MVPMGEWIIADIPTVVRSFLLAHRVIATVLAVVVQILLLHRRRTRSARMRSAWWYRELERINVRIIVNVDMLNVVTGSV